MQTRIDQFYKSMNNSRKSGSIKKSPDIKTSLISRKKSRLLAKKSSSPVCKNSKISSCKISGRQQMAQNSNTYLNAVKSPSSKISAMNSPTKVMEVKTAISSATIITSPIRNQSISLLTSNSQYIPKTPSPIKNELDKSQRYAKLTRRRLFKDETDELMSKAIENLNFSKEGAIANNDIDLQKVYSGGVFNYKYKHINTAATTRYEIDDVVVPTDTYAKHFFLVIAIVFSNPTNCGYFDENELDLIFSLLTLSKDAQALLIRMLKRKHMWHRIDSIKYDEISGDLKPIFHELTSRSIFKSNMDEENLSILLHLLQVDEIRKICQQSKINSGGNKKEDYIQSIMKFCNTTKSLFSGMQSPASKLRASVNKSLGSCVLLNARVKQIVNKIITLLIPNRDATETLADVFLTLLRVEMDQMKFPEVTVSNFPIFANKEHLLNYIEAKNALTNILNAIEKKHWQTVRDLGLLAAQQLSSFLEVETQSLKDSTLPAHIRRFMPSYMWLKILSKSIDAFKKVKEMIPQAVEFLRTLIDQDCYMRSKKGQWYNDLIKIEMYHRKDIDASVRLLLDAVSLESLTEVDRLDLLERAEMLAKRKSGISRHAKDIIKSILDSKLSKARLTFGTSSITIRGTLCSNISQRKSTWCIINDGDQIYGTVESLALYEYKYMGYPKGIHCEGSFPITLFGILFWHELYNMNIPGAFVSSYQDVPMDLFSSEFYANRKEQIDAKLRIIRGFNSETLSRHLKQEFDLYCEFTSICQSNIFNDSCALQEIAFCLGVEGIVGICERLIHNYQLWKAGFPDLIVWNAYTKQYKIVEVKGPGDSLSTKQKLWLEYLNQLGLNTEICYCESNVNGGRKRKHEVTI